MATLRGAYVRKTEILRENYSSNKPELGDQDFVDLREACTQFLDKPRESSKPPEPKQWHRPWQRPVRESLGKLLLRAEIAAAVESGAVRLASNSSDGWEMQVLDGDVHGKLALA